LLCGGPSGWSSTTFRLATIRTIASDFQPETPPPNPTQRRPGSPHSKKLTPRPPEHQCDSILGSTRKYSSCTTMDAASTPCANWRAQPHRPRKLKTPNPRNAAKARFTPQQEANSPATRTSTHSILGSTRKYPSCPIWERSQTLPSGFTKRNGASAPQEQSQTRKKPAPRLAEMPPHPRKFIYPPSSG
jgi:hypothetical protein